MYPPRHVRCAPRAHAHANQRVTCVTRLGPTLSAQPRPSSMARWVMLIWVVRCLEWMFQTWRVMTMMRTTMLMMGQLATRHWWRRLQRPNRRLDQPQSLLVPTWVYRRRPVRQQQQALRTDLTTVSLAHLLALLLLRLVLYCINDLAW